MIRKASRLIRKEEARNIRRAFLYGCFTLTLSLTIIFLGIPTLIKMAIFLGNLRSSSLPIETQDLLPPSPPKLYPLPEATSSSQIRIKGSAEPGTTVKIFLEKKQEKEVITDNNGHFQLANLTLKPGKNEISATAIDKAGNESQQAKSLIVFYDRTAPLLEITEPVDGAEFFGEQNKVKIKGKTEGEATVLINEHLVVVDQEGNFNYLFSLKEGKNQIKITATDRAGNQTEKKLQVNYSP